MQKHLTFFIALFIGLSSVAQVNLDSLWNVWNDKTHPDTNRLKAMHDIAWEGYLSSQPDSAFYYYVKKPTAGEKAKVKLKAKKYNPSTRKHEMFIEKKLPPHSK